MGPVQPVIRTLKDLHIRLGEIGRAGTSIDFQPDDAACAEMAKTLGLVALLAFQAQLEVTLWLDGAQVRGAWSGMVVQTCGVSLDEFDTPLQGVFTVHVVPRGSEHAPQLDSEVDLDPDADDPPDVLEGERIDLAAYVIEHLGLEVDPFPRKPGAVFEPPEAPVIISPFAALRDLKS